ncbi:MAG TPA: GDCCVxC domain-containing (seleno)protein [Longimicrobiales bacterium]|nr:GDCCVxC domain-containing (seleno)protein [Longimicrobiales bacterium]
MMMQSGTLTCPECGLKTEEEMPEDACVHFFVCPGCATRLRPDPGSCCVFCSFGDRPCPPRARELAEQGRA